MHNAMPYDLIQEMQDITIDYGTLLTGGSK